MQGHYEKKGLAHVISAVPPPEEVFEEVIKALDLLLKQAPAPKQPVATIAAPAEPEPAAAAAPEQQAEEASPPEMAPIDAAIVFVLGKPKAEFTHENETKCCFMHTMPIHSPYTSIAKWV